MTGKFEQEKAGQDALQAKKLAEETSLKESGAVRVLVGLRQNSEQKLLKPGDSFQDFEDSPEMVMIPPGTFMMGSPDDEPGRIGNETLHEVTILESFALGRYPVTFAQWNMYVVENKGGMFGGKAYNPNDQGRGRGKRPVINVSWDDAQNYIKWLNERTGHVYGLPTEAQWEYAARAGTKTPFSVGDTITTNQANYDGNYPYNNDVKGGYQGKTLPVDSFDANPFGLYQVHGNVWEWVSDWYGGYEKGSQTNPKGAKSGLDRVMRGGGWYYGAARLRSASRGYYSPDKRYNFIGFRLMRRPF